MGHLLMDILRNSVLITGLVVIMMMMIESLNIESKGLVFKGLRKTKLGQVIVAALLGSVPGCMGGFAAVSLYTHRMFSFGALVAMMIASSGDEAFMMLAMIPEQALIIFSVLFVIAVVAGVVIDRIADRRHLKHCKKHNHEDCGIEMGCTEGFVVHDHDMVVNSGHDGGHAEAGAEMRTEAEAQAGAESKAGRTGQKAKRTFGWRRIVMFVGLAVFIAALASGQLGHDHSAHAHNHTGHTHDHPAHEQCKDELCIEEHCMTEKCQEYECHDGQCQDEMHGEAKGLNVNLLDEEWMNVLFAGLSVIMLLVLILGSDHFVNDHLWNHIVKKHLPTIFAWTFGVLLVVGIGLQFIDIEHWISRNTVLMILLATLVGIIPESGPHMIFVTLYATGVIPFPVLLASCISQDGHASIPLLAESKKSFAWAKLINCIVALVAGYAAMLIM